MKNIGLLFAVAFALASTNAHAVFDLGVVGGVTSNYAAQSTLYFTYGVTAGVQMGSLGLGVKGTNLSGPSQVVSGVNITTGQLNLMGQIKYTNMGFFVGANVGVGITSAGASVAGISVATTTSALVYGPTVGYYFGGLTKIGVEVDYLLSSASGWTNTLVPMAGFKFAI